MEEVEFDYDSGTGGGSSGGSNASTWIQSILGSGGIGSAASGAGDMICALKGNCAPKNLTVVNQAPQRNNNTLLLIGGGVVLLLIVFLMIRN